MQYRLSMAGKAVALVVSAIFPLSASVVAQQQTQTYDYLYPQQPMPEEGLPVSPFFEGWYDNGDGTYTLSFGYLNRNDTTVVQIPRGEDNFIDNSDFQGVQPTVFQPGRNRGVYAVTISDQEMDVWWRLNSEEELHEVPGRARIGSYELDRRPRPHGSIPPIVWFANPNNAEGGPAGVTAEQDLRAGVGEPVTLSVNVEDESEHETDSPGFSGDEVPVRVVWSLFHGNPAAVEYSRHPSNPEPEEESPRGGGAETIRLSEGEGEARVNVTFSEPGEYVFRAQADNFAAVDSSSNDQCCWSNGYQRVVISE